MLLQTNIVEVLNRFSATTKLYQCRCCSRGYHDKEFLVYALVVKGHKSDSD